MAHDKDGSINEEHTSRDVPRFKSSLEDVDFAVYKFVDEVMDVRASTNKGFKKTPVIWSGSERAHNIKDDDINRDSSGMIILPVISIERTSVKKDEASRVIPYSKVDPTNDLKGGYLTVNRVIQQDKTRNFANADAYRRAGQNNFPLYKKGKNGKVVYETLTIPIPIYVTVGYKIVLRTEYQEQMNSLTQPFIARTGQINAFTLKRNGHLYEAFINQDFTQNNNVSDMQEDLRMYTTEIGIRVLGYIIGEGENDDRPIVRVDENTVEVTFPRELDPVLGNDGFFEK